MKAILAWLAGLFRWPEIEPEAPAPQRRMTSSDGVALIKHYESLSLRAYRDPVGILTIGYGDTQNVTPGMVITEADAEVRLRNRLSGEFEPGVITALARSPRQCEMDAMVSLAYNVGVAAFKKSTLVRKFNAGEPAQDEFLRWDKAGGKSLKGLRRRRASERALFMGMTLDVALKIGANHD